MWQQKRVGHELIPDRRARVALAVKSPDHRTISDHVLAPKPVLSCQKPQLKPHQAHHSMPQHAKLLMEEAKVRLGASTMTRSSDRIDMAASRCHMK